MRTNSDPGPGTFSPDSVRSRRGVRLSVCSLDQGGYVVRLNDESASQEKPMSSVDSAPGKAPALIERAKNILLKPGAEWDKIAGEASTIQDILKNYVLILAAIGPIASLIGRLAFGYGFGFRPNPIYAVASAIVMYVVTVAGVYVTALVIDALA